MLNEIHKRFVASIESPVVKYDPINGHRYQGWSPCIRWCEENLDNRGWWYIGEGVFEFSSKQDHLLFMLRWA
jgi:hypothetical protein